MSMSGRDLRDRRESAGLSQQELAELLDVSRVWLALQEKREDVILDRRTELAVVHVTECDGRP